MMTVVANQAQFARAGRPLAWPYYPELLAKPVPRYTSFPTAVEFHEGITAADYAHALDTVEAATPMSLYIHIPYCDQICWYCGCNTGAANKTKRLTAYLQGLESELAMVAKRVGGRGKVRHIAFGGGSPNAIAPVDFVRLLDRIMTLFEVQKPTISVEIDPRGFDAQWALVLAASNVTRVSMGVQTFADHVQAAIGRVQPTAMIEQAVNSLHMRGIDAVNFDLMYGLPDQSMDDLAETLATAIAMKPSRIALFGYAHLPSAIPRQRRIDATNLPDADTRFAMASMGYQMLTEAGYRAVGFDHFVLPDDPLAKAQEAGTVHRNFQGFTEDDAPVLLGFGASAITVTPGLLVQNLKNAGEYRTGVNANGLPVERGVALTSADQRTRAIINGLLCQGAAILTDDEATMMADRLSPFTDRGLIAWDGTAMTLTHDARPYARTIAAQFDPYRDHAAPRFSSAI